MEGRWALVPAFAHVPLFPRLIHSFIHIHGCRIDDTHRYSFILVHSFVTKQVSLSEEMDVSS